MLTVLKPLTITTDAQIVSTNVVESADVTWSAASTYALAATVKYNHIRYESLQAANLNHLPDAVNSTWWLELGPTNLWAVFDSQTSTKTTATTSTMTYRIKPGGIFNSVAVIGVTGASNVTVNIYAGAGGTPIWTITKSLDNTFISSWYQWLFEPYELYTDLSFGQLDSPTTANGWGAYISGEFEVIITKTASAASVGCAGIMVGTTVELGEVQYGATAGIQDYSIKETDGFGVTTLVQRNFAKRSTYSLWIPNTQIRRVHSTLAQLRATPCVWVASDDYSLSPLTVFGFYKDFSINVAYPDYSTATLEVEGLT